MSFNMVIALIGGVVVADQFIKLWATANLLGKASIVLIPGLLKLTYVMNYGAAFGMMSGMRWFLVILTGIILLGLIWALYTNKIEGLWMRLPIAMIVAGGIGNLIDRMRLGYVVDYLDINDFFSFPMFNLADCFVVVGAIILVVYVLFFEAKEQKDQGV